MVYPLIPRLTHFLPNPFRHHYFRQDNLRLALGLEVFFNEVSLRNTLWQFHNILLVLFIFLLNPYFLYFFVWISKFHPDLRFWFLVKFLGGGFYIIIVWFIYSIQVVLWFLHRKFIMRDRVTYSRSALLCLKSILKKLLRCTFLHILFHPVNLTLRHLKIRDMQWWSHRCRELEHHWRRSTHLQQPTRFTSTQQRRPRKLLDHTRMLIIHALEQRLLIQRCGASTITTKIVFYSRYGKLTRVVPLLEFLRNCRIHLIEPIKYIRKLLGAFLESRWGSRSWIPWIQGGESHILRQFPSLVISWLL